ncbi:hypothetical protein [Streptomyces sp. CBMA123]|uniref:hypothetical protein n=1 Tax=Streptomyces sp. CBMA123 TaxID=1896313 RepID=UPI001661A34D|nr:hypothetical protein [Streptomyces sp. CBMA123]
MFLAAPGRPAVVSVAARPARVMQNNDDPALLEPHGAGHAWPPGTGRMPDDS